MATKNLQKRKKSKAEIIAAKAEPTQLILIIDQICFQTSSGAQDFGTQMQNKALASKCLGTNVFKVDQSETSNGKQNLGHK